MGKRPRSCGESGAAAVELALLAPLLLLLLLGAVDFGWLFAEHLDARHGAREAGRLAATNYGPTPAIVAAACSFMDNSVGTTISLSGATGALGDDVVVTVRRPAQTITRLLDWAVPDSLTLTGTSTFRLEKLPSWTNTADSPC